jgi:hypothetical protein
VAGLGCRSTKSNPNYNREVVGGEHAGLRRRWWEEQSTLTPEVRRGDDAKDIRRRRDDAKGMERRGDGSMGFIARGAGAGTGCITRRARMCCGSE